MKHRQKKTAMKFLCPATAVFIIAATSMWGGDDSFTVIKNPKPTCEEKVYVELVKVGEIIPNLDDEKFLVFPLEVEVDGNGNIFVYDSKQVMIFKYDRNLKYVATLGKPGRGPSELGCTPREAACVSLFTGSDNILYVGDRKNAAIHCFNLDGTFIKDIRIKSFRGAAIDSIKDQKNNFYSYTTLGNDKCIAIYNEKGELNGSLLDRKELDFSLFFSPGRTVLNGSHQFPCKFSIPFGVVDNGRLAVFNHNSGYFYIFSNGRLQTKKPLWPKKALEFYKWSLSQIKDEREWFPYFTGFFIDNDNKKFFYLNLGKTKDNQKFPVYMFDLKGKLIKVFYVDGRNTNGYIRFQCKRNNLFYAIGPNKDDERTIFIYKEAAKK